MTFVKKIPRQTFLRLKITTKTRNNSKLNFARFCLVGLVWLVSFGRFCFANEKIKYIFRYQLEGMCVRSLSIPEGINLLTLRVNQGLTKIGRECDADIYFLHENLASKQSKRDFSCTMNKWKVTASTSRLQFCKSWRFIKNAHQKLSQQIFATQSDKTAFYNINTRIYLSWSIN